LASHEGGTRLSAAKADRDRRGTDLAISAELIGTGPVALMMLCCDPLAIALTAAVSATAIVLACCQRTHHVLSGASRQVLSRRSNGKQQAMPRSAHDIETPGVPAPGKSHSRMIGSASVAVRSGSGGDECHSRLNRQPGIWIYSAAMMDRLSQPNATSIKPNI
jgi:hypothetical protein